MESEKAKKYLEHQYDAEKGRADKLVVEDYNQYAIQAVELAEKELKDKAIEACRKSCFYLCTDNKCTSFVHNVSILHTEYGKCNSDCNYMKIFKELLNK